MAGSQRCDFCYHQCLIAVDGLGRCGVRGNREGVLRTVAYGKVVSCGLDPIEKKPFHHFLPGELTCSFALFGCNYTCLFCQNHRITQQDSPLFPNITDSLGKQGPVVTPQQMVEVLDAYGSRIMSYTYSEPMVWQDYMLDTARLVHQKGKLNCMVTNGSFSPAALERILIHMDAFNIDVKGDGSFYRDYCGGRLEPVVQAIGVIARTPKKILEVTTMVIEGVHDAAMISRLGRALYDAGVQVWHLSRFYPQYRMQNTPPTSEGFLEAMLLEAQASGIPYIYAGNSTSTRWNATRCPQCKTELMRSHTYGGEAGTDSAVHIHVGKCVHCGAPIYGLFDIPPQGAS